MAKSKKQLSKKEGVKKKKTGQLKTKRTSIKKTPNRSVPQLPEVAPELKSHIISRSSIRHDHSYWRALAWLSASLLGVLIVTGSIIWLIQLKNPPQKPVAAPLVQTSLNNKYLAPLTGLPSSPETLNRRPWAVVVENFVTVRPQAGLSSADIVFESPTEGGITRLVAIYQSQLPKTVGPIRSARSYFNDWIRPFSPFYSHSGGSNRALQQLKAGYGGIVDINEFFHGIAYTRQPNLQAPHNLFTTPEKFFSYLDKNKFNLISEVPKINFTNSLPLAPKISVITLPYVPQEYEVTYEYQTLTGTYQRIVNGTTQLDANNNQILMVKNVVVMFTDINPIPNDPLLRVELRTIGTGEVKIYTGGAVYVGLWKKNSPDSMIQFVDNAGNPLPLQPGNTWISVMDTSASSKLPSSASQLSLPL